jgi:nucleoside-diphosphate-sugar epimerase
MNVTLITGADGHVGGAVARWLLERSGDELLLFVRAAGGDEQRVKRERLGALGVEPRCRVVFGDLRAGAPFAGVEPDGVTGILHCAAVTGFTVDRATATEVNVLGTAKVLEFAGRCTRLRRFGLVSTIYACGLRDGAIDETAFDEAPGYANFYEWSKWQAERLVLERPELPWHIYRLATIVAEDGHGAVVQQNALHNTLRLLYYGLLSVVPGDPGTRVYTATTAGVAHAIGSLFLHDDTNGIRHLSDAGGEALTLGELMDIAYEAFLAEPAFARRRILKPLFCDQDSFASLVEGAGRFGGILGQSLKSVAPFARQLYCDKDVRTERTERALGGRPADDPKRVVGAAARFLVRTRWGCSTRGEPA